MFNSEILESPGFISTELWPPGLTFRTLTLSISLQDLGLHAAARLQEARHG